MSILKFFKKQNNSKGQHTVCTICGKQKAENATVYSKNICLCGNAEDGAVISSANKYFSPSKLETCNKDDGNTSKNSCKKLSLSSRLSLKRSVDDTVTLTSEKKVCKESDIENNFLNCAEHKNENVFSVNISSDSVNSQPISFISPNSDKNFVDHKKPLIDGFTEDIKSIKRIQETTSIYEDDVVGENTKGIPYYLNNFKYILDSVFQYEDDARLFNEDDQEIIHSFSRLSDEAQKLYVRLFQRKHKWLRANKVEYSEIADNMEPILQELCNRKFLLGSNDLDSIECALNLSSLPELKLLAKSFQVNIVRKGKHEIIDLLLKHGRRSRSVCSSGNITDILLKRTKKALGSCYKLRNEVRDVFIRVLMLFSLTSIVENEDDASGGLQQQLFTLLMVKSGKLVFPEYEIIRKTVLFGSREDLIMYVNAKHLENEILQDMETKNFHTALQIYYTVKEIYKRYCLQSLRERDLVLPSFLRRFTAGHVYVRCLAHGVDILQRLRNYNEAVTQLEELLEQKVYCGNDRGRWWDRLALNLDQHLKSPLKSMSAIQNGLADEHVKCGHRLNLYNRGKRLCETYSKKHSFKLSSLPEMKVTEAPKVFIKGRLLPRTIPGRTHLFISSCSSESLADGDISVLPVEDLALEHYRSQGYNQGIHGEGSTFITLLSLYFWEEIYNCKIPDAFHCAHQTHPLDLNSDYFYKSRKSEIDKRLNQIQECSLDELVELGKEVWIKHEGKMCLIQWDNFTDWQQVEGLIRCLGNSVIAGICRRLAQNFRFCRSGGPDLVVWNPNEFLIKFVEVKGPGDQLSSKQILWLDYLLSLGADAEVCYIEAISSKQLHR